MRGESQKMQWHPGWGWVPHFARLPLGEVPRAGPANKGAVAPALLWPLWRVLVNTLHFQSLKIALGIVDDQQWIPGVWRIVLIWEYLGHVPCNLTSAPSRRHTASGPLCAVSPVMQCAFTACESISPLGKEKKNQRTLCWWTGYTTVEILILQYLNTFSAKMVK